MGEGKPWGEEGQLRGAFAAGRVREARGQLSSAAAAASCQVFYSGHRLQSHGAIKVSHHHPARANSAAWGSVKRVPRCKVAEILE